MTQHQLQQVKKFAQPFYLKTGRYHAWNHSELVTDCALRLSASYPETNVEVLKAACYLHDIGRSIKDEGHPEVGAELAKPFLNQIGVLESEVAVILEAVGHHDVGKILQAKSLEAKLLFDADKLQIVTVFGFTRCLLWLIEERKMEQVAALEFLYEYSVSVVNKYLRTPEAKKIAQSELPLVAQWVQKNIEWNKLYYAI